MRIFTSYFGALKKLSIKQFKFVAICQGVPKWFTGSSYTDLAPNWQLVYDWKSGQITPEQYTERFTNDVLNNLDYDKVINDLMSMSDGEDVVLLCFEKPTDFCHRHLVARWLQNHGCQCDEVTF